MIMGRAYDITAGDFSESETGNFFTQRFFSETEINSQI